MHFIFPKPQDWNTFEDIVCDVFARKYRNMNLQRYGRNGQRQHGIDIAGWTSSGLLGVQCKHHPDRDIEIAKIDEEIAESEKFIPELSEYVIATSAERDVKSQGHILALAPARQQANKYPVTIKYWDDICGWLSEYPDLVYKHFTKFYSHQELEHLYLASLEGANRQSIRWPCTADELIDHATATLGGISKIEPYLLSVGFTTFESPAPLDKIDLDISLADSIRPNENSENAFRQAAEVLRQVKRAVLNPFFARKLLIYPQARLSYAFLLGWTFRRVAGFSLFVVSHQEVWPSEGLLLTHTRLTDDFPLIKDSQSDEIVLVLNVSRDIKPSVVEYVESLDTQPKAIVSYRLEGGFVTSAAHAFSLALEISRRIKNLSENWGVRKIHLFAALPTALAVLVGHHLNAICPITIYYLDDSRTTYRSGGTLSNSL